jgi:rubrerythrin
VDSAERRQLEAAVTLGGRASLRDLAAAEAAVLRGQFNLAKVLRALAHTQRVQGMNAARLLAAEEQPALVLDTILAELENASPATSAPVTSPAFPAASVDDRIARTVQERAQALAARSVASLRAHSDVAESDVAPFICGCFACGNLMEVTNPDAAPESCAVCGALSPEFAWFEPFYSITPEHLGERRPEEILTILTAIPDEVAQAISGVSEIVLQRKPAPDEWGVNEIMAHMLEVELLFNRRVSAILAHAGPGLPSISSPTPPWKLHEGKGYEEAPSADILAHLRATRATTLTLAASLTPAQWARRGSNVEGTATVLDLGTWLANHDLGHLAQIQRLCGGLDPQR